MKNAIFLLRGTAPHPCVLLTVLAAWRRGIVRWREIARAKSIFPDARKGCSFRFQINESYYSFRARASNRMLADISHRRHMAHTFTAIRMWQFFRQNDKMIRQIFHRNERIYREWGVIKSTSQWCEQGRKVITIDQPHFASAAEPREEWRNYRTRSTESCFTIPNSNFFTFFSFTKGSTLRIEQIKHRGEPMDATPSICDWSIRW